MLRQRQSALPFAPLQATNGFWQEVTLKDGTKMSFAELLKIGQEDPKKEVTILAQLPDESRRIQKMNYNNWKIVWLNQEVNQKIRVDMNVSGGE